MSGLIAIGHSVGPSVMLLMPALRWQLHRTHLQNRKICYRSLMMLIKLQKNLRLKSMTLSAVVLTFLCSCATSPKPAGIDYRPVIPALSPHAQMPLQTPWCSPSCSDALSKEQQIWLDMLTNIEPL